jgi:alkylation response protein AidB-like acyl-CoA dehydrogenase
MRFLPTDEQVELQRGVRELLDRRFPLDKLPAGWDPQLWRELTETGVFGLRVDLELGMAEAALVYEELGRACVPGPLVGTFLARGHDVSPEHSDAVVTVLEPDHDPLLVAHCDVATAVLVLGSEPTLTAVPSGSPVADLVDPLTPLRELPAVPTGMVLGDATLGERLRMDGAVLTAALQVGIAARLTELAVDYAKTREQFGRVIGSFQAVKHLCADMFVRAELARVAVHAAAVTLDDPESDDAVRAVAGAKLLADEAAVTNGRSAIQVHGGMGFTWEVPVHFFLKRAWLHATEFGTADDHAEDLAAQL